MLRHGMQNLRVIAFDADDTLWHNEVIFERVHERYRDLLSNYHDAETVNRTLFATEMRNLELYGYGVKGFTLSAIETAIELTAGKISAEEIRTLLERGRAMLNHPVELLDQVADTLNGLTDKYDLWLITKGDLRDQERKLEKSGLREYFRAVEIVSEKNTATYATILQLRHTAPAEFLMVGNSLHSDILPVLELGASAAHVPYHLTWEHERSEILPDAPGRFFELAHLRELPALLLNPSSA
jgi:putative hydrolase of the HAD superfamily